MNAQMLPPESRNYLQQLEHLLAGIPAASRASAIDDVTAHIEESLASGRSAVDTIAGLGPVEVFAAQYLEEFRVTPSVQPATLRQTGLLHLVAVGVALLACVYAAFLSTALFSTGTTMNSDGTETAFEESSNFVEIYGIGGLLLLFLPALLALLPLILPPSWRTSVAIANAVLITGFAALGIFTIGGFYAPLAVMMWAAVIVPWRMSKRLQLVNSPYWRIFGSALIALPAFLLASGGLSGSLRLDPVTVVGTGVVIFLAILFAVGVRASALAVAILGLAGMVLAMAEGGMMAFSFWWFGGLFLAAGISAFVAWGTEEPAK